jgi:hypothetical protein
MARSLLTRWTQSRILKRLRSQLTNRGKSPERQSV